MERKENINLILKIILEHPIITILSYTVIIFLCGLKANNYILRLSNKETILKEDLHKLKENHVIKRLTFNLEPHAEKTLNFF